MEKYEHVEATFDELYGSLIIPVFLFDSKARLIKVNKSFLELTKASIDNLHQYFLSSFLRRFSDGLARLEFVPEHYVTEITGLDGREIPVIINYIKLLKNDGTYGGGLIFITDLRDVDALKERLQKIILEYDPVNPQLVPELTEDLLEERKRLKRDAQEAQEFLENVLESCGDGVIIAGGNGRITYVNEAFLKIVGKTKAEILDHKFFELGPQLGTFTSTAGEQITLDQPYVDRQIKNVEEILRREDAGKIQNWVWYAFQRDEVIVPLEVTVSVRKNAEDAITGFISIFRDITERRIAEKALQEAYQFRTQFYTNITHEFRTPLTLVIGPLEGVLRSEFGTIGQDVRQQLAVAMTNSRQMLKLVNQLLDFSMLESGTANIIYEKRDLKRFTAAILDSFSAIAKQKRIKVTFSVPSDLPQVLIDPVKMEKALYNLLGNAFKYTPRQGSIAVTVETETAQQALAHRNAAGMKDPAESEAASAATCGYVKISVADTGIGIKQDDLDLIFDRFKRGSSNSAQKLGGTGIGLAHAQELIELIGGWITVKSRYGKGSVFCMYIPLKTDQTDGKESVDDEGQEILYLQPEIELADLDLEKDVVAENISGTKPLVLVVEDNAAVRRYISNIIRTEYDFMEAQNGLQALRKIRQHKPDLILCDVMMPVMDGYEFLRRVKSNPDLNSIAFVFLTAKADTEMKIEGLEEGADDYIVKPFNSLELLARVKALLRLRELISKTEDQERKIDGLTQKLQDKYHYANIVGNSLPMRRIYQLLETIKDSDSTVLISGETGTGKELIANAIHYNSPRKNAALISVNCGAIPTELMEREFFGHVKGAYTGAVESRKGYFQEADGGTLFLDEIGEMNKDMQVKLLRVLEQGDFVRVGDAVPTKVDVRLIAASNKDLRKEVEKGNFREDLFYRVYVLPIHLPALRERSEDIPLLIQHFLNKLQTKRNIEIPDISEKEMRLLMSHPYPGNVRELEYIIERFCLLGGTIESLLHFQEKTPREESFVATAYSELLLSANPLKTAGQQAKARAEKEIIMHALRLCNNNHTEAAKKLNICRASLYRKLKNGI